jgi:Rad3-related DNA helicase
MFQGMGATVAKIKEVTPGGMLIFHPTYALMRKTQEYWKLSDEKMCVNAAQNMFKRQVFMEPSDKNELDNVTNKFESAIITDPKEMVIKTQKK